MAKSRAIWGIDIGQTALKALRCQPADDDSQILADAFDYIEYPKILSQPEADPVELIRDALTQFLARNTVKGDRVAISVAGQNGLSRFIKLPPVESKKIPDIVRYEAKQQIPFALEDVIWRYQQMAGGSVEDGFALETEVGLFTMKREQVFRALKPFNEAGIEVDIVQLAPLAVYNCMVFDKMQDLPPPEEYDPENPPDSVVIIAMGTDGTDLVVTNGYRIWQRSIPLGGSHFTKALTKELKLTFARAEHLKRNASQADDAKAIFQAMRPVFSDLVVEVQRSIGYFTNIDRKAKIGSIVALGNAMKLPGLHRFVAQNLGLDVDRVESFRGLVGPGVVDAPTFKENVPAFGVCYGLALQGLRSVRINTNLLPEEITQERMIRAKKPWAVAAAALLLTGLAVSFGGDFRAFNSVSEDRFGLAESGAKAVNAKAQKYAADYKKVLDDFKKASDVGDNLVRNVEGRILWMEIYKAVNASLPKDPPGEEVPAEVNKQERLNITSIAAKKEANLATWFDGVKNDYEPPKVDPAAAAPAEGASAATPPAATPAAATPAAGASATATTVTPPSGAGVVFTVKGYHFHNGDKLNEGAAYVLKTLVANLQKESIEIPSTDEGEPPRIVPVADLGISHVVLVDPGPIRLDYQVEDPNQPEEAAEEGGSRGGNRPAKKMIDRPIFEFTVQFAWVETPPSKRTEQTAPAAAQPLAAAPNQR